MIRERRSRQKEVVSSLRPHTDDGSGSSGTGNSLPFPVYEEETELYSNEKSKKELGMAYTSFQEGMKKTYRAFKGVFV